jgi:hypothetical protein
MKMDNKPPESEKISQNEEEKILPPVIIGDEIEHRARCILSDGFTGGETGAYADRIRGVCHMAALGYKNRDIAAQLDLAETTVSRLRNLPESRVIIREIQGKLYAANPAAMFKTMAPQAARTLYTVMKNKEEKGSTRVSAASEILDRAYGKALQTVEHSGNMLRDIFDRMDQEAGKKKPDIVMQEAEFVEESSKVIIVGKKEELPLAETKEVSEDIDEWVKKNLK